jgi:hypothetical protein
MGCTGHAALTTNAVLKAKKKALCQIGLACAGGGLDLLVRHETRDFQQVGEGFSLIRNAGAWLRGVLC